MLYKGKDRNYTREDLEALADLGIFPSSLGVFTKADTVDDYEIDLMLLCMGLPTLNLN
jgi:hypothetical protein